MKAENISELWKRLASESPEDFRQALIEARNELEPAEYRRLMKSDFAQCAHEQTE